jgi:uncharacterized protein (DUF1778 family)
MKVSRPTAEVNIHLRAQEYDRMLIDQAAELTGANRSQFMLNSAVTAAKNIILDQTTFSLDNRAFQQVLDWLDAPAMEEEEAGMKRLLAVKPPWANG